MSKVALVIIYNHQFNRNIEILEQIYKDKFRNIYHLVPFYAGEKSNVIPVYGTSIYFQGYVAQAYKTFFKEAYDHYFFIGDDLILNPLVTEENYREHLKLKPATCFIPRLSTLDESKVFWGMNFDAMLYNVESPGVEAKSQMPGYTKALDLLKQHGLENKPLKFTQVWRRPASLTDLLKIIKEDRTYLVRLLRDKVTKNDYRLTYPLVRSYADIFVVSRDVIREFCHYCGVTAATRLFAELAIPTSLAFSAKEIVTEKDLALQGRALWTKEDMQTLDKYGSKIKNLLSDFPPGQLYVHPVKLSKWETTL